MATRREVLAMRQEELAARERKKQNLEIRVLPTQKFGIRTYQKSLVIT